MFLSVLSFSFLTTCPRKQNIQHHSQWDPTRHFSFPPMLFLRIPCCKTAHLPIGLSLMTPLHPSFPIIWLPKLHLLWDQTLPTPLPLMVMSQMELALSKYLYRHPMEQTSEVTVLFCPTQEGCGEVYVPGFPLLLFAFNQSRKTMLGHLMLILTLFRWWFSDALATEAKGLAAG